MKTSFHRSEVACLRLKKSAIFPPVLDTQNLSPR